MEAIYYYDDQVHYLKIEILATSKESSWQAYVFDDNWNDILSSASSISERFTETIEFAKEAFGIRGRLSIVENLPLDNSLKEALEIMLFHLQALLFSSAILVENDCEHWNVMVLQRKSQLREELFISSSLMKRNRTHAGFYKPTRAS
ncbi:hypothetical protein [Cytobacillus oceanisediminis]|uniref:hypothetical protein n=1 Tax=Cytobacillus oceanisediminis TaxID=665099 RepID=UPI0011A30EDB|nr:hypothetical protein [Cytobacillus oceanisediminis]